MSVIGQVIRPQHYWKPYNERH